MATRSDDLNILAGDVTPDPIIQTDAADGPAFKAEDPNAKPEPIADLPATTNDMEIAYLEDKAEQVRLEDDPDSWMSKLLSGDDAELNGESPEQPETGATAPTQQEGDQDAGEVEAATSPPQETSISADQTPGEPVTPVDPIEQWVQANIRAGLVVAGGVRIAREVAPGIASDLGRGALEAPGAIVRGGIGAVNEINQSLQDFAAWINSFTPGELEDDPESPLNTLNRMREASGREPLTLEDLAEPIDPFFDPRETNTGKVIELITQFLSGKKIVGAITKATGMKAGKVKEAIDSMITGGVAFDPDTENPASAIQQIAPNPITEFLQSKPEDTGAEKRLKTMFAVAGLDRIAAGVIAGLRFIRAGIRTTPTTAPTQEAGTGAGTAAQVEAKTAAELVADAKDAAKLDVSTRQPPIEFSETLAKDAADFLAGRVSENPVKINMTRFRGSDDIKDTIANLSRFLPETGRISNKATIRAAHGLGMDPSELIAGNIAGNLFDRKQIAAGWMLFKSSADEVLRLGKIANETRSVVDISQFNAAFQISNSVLNIVKGQSSEIARALQIQNAIRSETPAGMKMLQTMIEEAGGTQVNIEMAERVARLTEPGQIEQFVRSATNSTTRDKIMFAWANSLMSNPATTIVNIGDTLAATLMKVPETWFAAKVGTNVMEGEASAFFYGLLSGGRDALRFASRTFKTGETAFPMGTRVDPINAQSFVPTADLSARLGSGLGQNPTMQKRGIDYLAALLPTRLNMTGDEFNKYLLYRASLNRQAYRETMEKGLSKEDGAKLAAEWADNPPNVMSNNAEMAARQTAATTEAIEGTFNEALQGNVAEGFQKLANGITIGQIPVGRMLFATFIRTPINLVRWTVHRTPTAILSPKIRADIAAGGVRRDMVLGRIAAGSTVMAAFADQTMSGRITGAGPKDPVLRENLRSSSRGWQAYSIYSNGEWWSYNRSGTIGSLIGIAADATELMTGIYTREKNTVTFEGEAVEDSIAAATVIPFANAMLSKVYFRQLSSFIDALANPDRYAKNWINRFSASFVPSVIGAIERTVDEDIRRAEDSFSAIRARIPVASSGLPQRLDRWGEPIKDENGIYNLFLPTRRRAGRGTPIDDVINDLRISFSAPHRIQNFSVEGSGGVGVSVELSEAQHNKLIELSGNKHKLIYNRKKYGMRDFLDALVTGKLGLKSGLYENLSDDAKRMMIKKTQYQFRKGAKQRLLKEDASLSKLVNAQGAKTAAKLLGKK